MRKYSLLMLFVLSAGLVLTACQGASNAANPSPPGAPKVLAAESFLADIAQQIAGDRLTVDTLIPSGIDPHAFEPTPQDVTTIAKSDVLIINGGGLEEAWLQRVLDNAGGQRAVVVASQGLETRQPQPGEPPRDETGNVDPHFWLNPINVITYVSNIRDALIQADPEGRAVYSSNAQAYVAQLHALDQWIQEQVQTIPPAQRKIITNHESFGYYADRYNFKIVGTVIPSFSSLASPSAQQMADLIDRIRQSGARVIFLETGANPQLADQIAQETGIQVVSDLYTHSTSAAGGPAASYLEMMRYDTRQIVQALQAAIQP